MTEVRSNGEPDRPNRFEPSVVGGKIADVYPDWEAVYQDNVVGIYQLAFRKVGNAADAEDLAEEVLMHTLKTLRLPAPVHEVRAYLAKTARTVVADHWRRHYAARTATAELERLPPGALAEAPSSAATDRAHRLLALLPDRMNRVLELRFLRGYSVREAAQEMALSEANVRVLQFRALRKAAELEGQAFE